MARSLSEFLEHFVLPLLGGGPLSVGAPLRMRERELLLEQAGELLRPELQFLRMRRAQLLVADPSLPAPDPDELSLWIGLHNTLVFDHPERHRVWSRSTVWRRVEGATRSLLTLPSPTSRGETLARHVSVGALVELTRADMVVSTPAGELRAIGQELPRRALRLLGPSDAVRHETVRWAEQPHAPETQRLLEDALRASPLTCVLRPLLAPPGWSPLSAADAFSDRALVRAICHTWARHRDWVAVGGAVAGALLPSLPDPSRPERAGPPQGEGPLALPGAVLPTDPQVLAGVVGALVHLHFLKVVELDARLGVAAVSRDPGVTAFLALPLLLPRLQDTMGAPLGGLEELDQHRTGHERLHAPLARRWIEYLDHLQELMPQGAVDKLLASLVPRIVQTP
ncbi:MAG: hypothetical protein H6712_01765 [Myxococcales bacterium]|nr:hypothetical protein [Myxococcales bacterium]MCB9712553.1 hypothetical protein [Myxococcales bacterium]